MLNQTDERTQIRTKKLMALYTIMAENPGYIFPELEPGPDSRFRLQMTRKNLGFPRFFSCLSPATDHRRRGTTRAELQHVEQVPPASRFLPVT